MTQLQTCPFIDMMVVWVQEISWMQQTQKNSSVEDVKQIRTALATLDVKLNQYIVCN